MKYTKSLAARVVPLLEANLQVTAVAIFDSLYSKSLSQEGSVPLSRSILETVSEHQSLTVKEN